MGSIIEQLSEIEATAEAIVDHAEKQKAEIEKKIQAERNQFDCELEEKTQEKLGAIREEAKVKVDEILSKQREKNQYMLESIFRKNMKKIMKYMQRRL